jgi:hypothetical protein
MKHAVFGAGYVLAIVGLVGCSGAANGSEVTAEGESAVTPAACGNMLGAWKATLAGATVTSPILGGAPVGISGEIDFTMAAGAAPDQAAFNGSITLTVPIVGAISVPVSGISVTCGPTLHLDSNQSFPVVGPVHFVIDAALNVGQTPISGTGTFRTDTPAGAAIPFSAAGSLNFLHQ